MTSNQVTATRAPVLAGLGAIETPEDVIDAVTRVAVAGARRLPRPGAGDAATRFRAPSEIAAVRQHHVERDLPALGRAVLDTAPWR